MTSNSLLSLPISDEFSCRRTWILRGLGQWFQLGLQRWKLLGYRFGCKFKIYICHGNQKFVQLLNLLVVQYEVQSDNAKMLQASNGNNNAGLFTTDVAPIDPKQSGIYLRWQDISNGLVSLDSDIILKVPFVGKSARNHMVVFFCLAPTASTPGAKSFSPTTRRGTRINPLGVLVTLKLLTWLRSAESQIFY